MSRYSLGTIASISSSLSPKLYIFIIQYPTSPVDISKLISYYTDSHDVDEDMRIIPIHGGRWIGGITAGVFDRAMDDAPDHDTYIVASRKKNKPPLMWGV